jgi:mannosyltransferase OCH1-like enzyme
VDRCDIKGVYTDRVPIILGYMGQLQSVDHGANPGNALTNNTLTAYNIQRADAIRYFVLHKFGGIYMDLDIGCRAHPGPLMHFESILPVTKPVGVSNDLLFSAPATPFMDLVINSLETFNHEWLWMNYPTVMFSTGPMFISAIYSMWNRILDKGVGVADEHLHKRVRILPKALYGKNALPENVPESFFWHYYGSSWHASDAGFIGFVSLS